MGKDDSHMWFAWGKQTELHNLGEQELTGVGVTDNSWISRLGNGWKVVPFTKLGNTIKDRFEEKGYVKFGAC